MAYQQEDRPVVKIEVIITQLAWFAGICILVFGPEPLYRQPLFDYSIDLIDYIQGTLDHSTRELWGTISEVGHIIQNDYIYILCIFLPYNMQFYCIFVFQSTYCFTKYLKSAY
jgi:hypothetical protein